MRLVIILAILVVAYLVYRAVTADTKPLPPTETLPTVEEVSIPDTKFKKSIQLAVSIVLITTALITAAFLL
jgi:hypothetical protein